MNPDAIKLLFPNASRSLLAANVEGARTNPELERNPGNGTLAEGAAKKANSTRLLVRITSVRKRLLDEDNLCEKYLLDCCRYSGLIRDDSPEEIHVETFQRKAGKDEEEHTLIWIYEPDEN